MLGTDTEERGRIKTEGPRGVCRWRGKQGMPLGLLGTGAEMKKRPQLVVNYRVEGESRALV